MIDGEIAAGIMECTSTGTTTIEQTILSIPLIKAVRGTQDMATMAATLGDMKAMRRSIRTIRTSGTDRGTNGAAAPHTATLIRRLTQPTPIILNTTLLFMRAIDMLREIHMRMTSTSKKV